MIYLLDKMSFKKKEEALSFLKTDNFHWILRNEILFGLIPKTIDCNGLQHHLISNLLDVLKNGGFLRGQGIMQLESVRRFYEIIDEKPDLIVKQNTIPNFCRKVSQYDLNEASWPLITLKG